MQKILKCNNGGIAIVLLWSIIFFIVMLVSVFMLDVYYANVKSEIAKDATTMAALSIYKDIDISQLESGNITVNEDMENTFKTYLAKNLRLNSNLTAMSNSIAIGNVEIVDFLIFGLDSEDTIYPNGQKIHYKPSLYVKIKFDIEPILKGIVGSRKTVYTSATADLIASK